jgi:hypothetical protein
LEEAQRSVRGSAEAVTPPTETTLGITGVGEKILEDYSAAELAKMKAAAGEPPWGAFTETEAWEEVGRIEEAKELFRKGEIDADEMARRQTIPDEEIERMYRQWDLEDAEEGLAKFGFEETIAERRAAEAVTPPPATVYDEYALGDITREEMLEATAEAVTPPPAAAADKAARRAVARRKVIAACTEGKCPMAEGATVAVQVYEASD